MYSQEFLLAYVHLLIKHISDGDTCWYLNTGNFLISYVFYIFYYRSKTVPMGDDEDGFSCMQFR